MPPDDPQPPQQQGPPDVHPGLAGLPGTGLWGWLGRQIGHVRHAMKTDVTAPAPAPPPKTIYRDTKVEEQPMPDDPRVKLRRTTIDEVVVDEGKPKEPSDKK